VWFVSVYETIPKRKIMKSALKRIANLSICQPLWERLITIALTGMNIGGGGNVDDSGESFVLNHLFSTIFKVPPLVVFDVGANIGDYAEHVISRLSPDNLRLYCFEPSASTFATLTNRLSGHQGIHLSNVALGSKEGKLTLYSNAPGSGVASVYNRRLDHFGVTMENTETVKVSTIDAFCDNNNIDFIHLLKLDVEGHELEVLKGTQLLLARNGVGAIQFEFGGCNIDSRTFFQDFYYLLNDRFKIYRVLKHGLFPIQEYKEIYELFVTTNFLALQR
jgi:FkbM family methyltransferase